MLLALGPLFIALLFFESTKRFFEAWIAQLSNYAFITVLTVLVAALMLAVSRRQRKQPRRMGGGIEIAHAVKVCVAAALTFLDHAAGDADGAGSCERPRAVELRCGRQCVALGHGARPVRRPGSGRVLARCLHRSGQEPLGQPVAARPVNG